jgi:hypothetical protein
VRRRIFSRYWYVRSDTHVYDYEGSTVEISPDTDETSSSFVKRWRGQLFTLYDVTTAKKLLRDRGHVNNVRAVKVTIYRKARSMTLPHLEQILKTTKNNLDDARAGDPTSCIDAAVQAAEALEAVLGLVQQQRASPEEVDATLAKLKESW